MYPPNGRERGNVNPSHNGSETKDQVLETRQRRDGVRDSSVDKIFTKREEKRKKLTVKPLRVDIFEFRCDGPSSLDLHYLSRELSKRGQKDSFPNTCCILLTRDPGRTLVIDSLSFRNRRRHLGHSLGT